MAIANKEEPIKVEDLMDTLSEEEQMEEHMSVDELEEMTELTQAADEEMEHQDEVSTIEPEENHIIVQQNPEVSKVEVLQPEIKQKTVVPPLRPLTIAPKPTKVPISFKTVPGQQLLLVQGTSPGQPIKLISPSQGINLSNLTLGGKTVTLKTNKVSGNTISLVQPKQILMKKVMTQVPKGAITKAIDSKQNQQIVVVQKADSPQIKLVQTSTAGILNPTPAKTLTLAQAQQMGLLTGTKLVPQAGGKQIILNKNQAKTLKLVPQQLKTPTKILPAPQNQANKVTQRIIIKPTGSNASTVLPGQLIQVGGQTINTGQLHQINIPGKGMQYIKFVTSSQAEGNTTNSATFQTVKTLTGISTKVVPFTSSGSSSLKSGFLSDLKPTNKLLTFTPKIGKPQTTTRLATPNQMVVLPLGYSPKTSTTQKVAITSVRTTASQKSPNSHYDAVVPSSNHLEPKVDTNGIRPRKPCNCTKSQCLKLYCDCFANGEFCFLCNCNNCHNNIDHEENRQRAIKNCLERNPSAFRPKIGKAKDLGDSAIRKHTKGCNCKRSGCLKNYCECYEAKIACSSNCRCLGCRNVEEQPDKKNNRLNDINFPTIPQLARINNSTEMQSPNRNKKISPRQSYNYITPDIIEATSHCLLSLSHNALEVGVEEQLVNKQIIEEFGRCLKQIIDCSTGKTNPKGA